MTMSDLRKYAEQLEEMHTVLASDLPKDTEGFVVNDGSELCDALRAMDRTVICLSRLSYRIAREGLS
jgi:hypothetical protein